MLYFIVVINLNYDKNEKIGFQNETERWTKGSVY